MGIKPLLSGCSLLLAVSTIVLPLASPPLSGHQALDTLSSALFQEHDEGKYSPKIEGGDQLLTSNVSFVTLLFQNKVMLLLKIMLIYDEALLNGQPPLSVHFPVPRGWQLNCGSTVSLGTLR